MTSPSKDTGRVEHTPTECGCISRMNEALAQHNMILVTNLIGQSRATIATCKIKSNVRGRQPILEANYCPFCGSKYQEQKSGAQS